MDKPPGKRVWIKEREWCKGKGTETGKCLKQEKVYKREEWMEGKGSEASEMICSEGK